MRTQKFSSDLSKANTAAMLSRNATVRCQVNDSLHPDRISATDSNRIAQEIVIDHGWLNKPHSLEQLAWLDTIVLQAYR